MTSVIHILDIRASKEASGSIPNLQAEILQGLSKPPGHRTLPSEVLYDEVGLKMYNEGLKPWSEWYYPLVAETEIVEKYGPDIAKLLKMSSDGRAVLIELGAGSLEKTSQILSALARIVEPQGSKPSITYYALDLERAELERTLAGLQENIGHEIAGKIATCGMWGTYDDGIRLIANNELGLETDVPVHILFLGGTIGNFSKGNGDVTFLKSLPLQRKRGDVLLLGMDRAKAMEAIERAYGFGAATTWVMNGLKVSGRLLGDEGTFDQEKWQRYSKYNEPLGRYEAGYTSTEDQTVDIPTQGAHITFSKDEVIQVMFSNKYTDNEIEAVTQEAGLGVVNSWMDNESRYYLLLLQASS